jgi:hypothetical protein
MVDGDETWDGSSCAAEVLFCFIEIKFLEFYGGKKGLKEGEINFNNNPRNAGRGEETFIQFIPFVTGKLLCRPRR